MKFERLLYKLLVTGRYMIYLQKRLKTVLRFEIPDID